MKDKPVKPAKAPKAPAEPHVPYIPTTYSAAALDMLEKATGHRYSRPPTPKPPTQATDAD